MGVTACQDPHEEPRTPCNQPPTLTRITVPRRNLELKARDRDPALSLRVCRELGAEDKGTLVQRDTYFEVPRGRLKLREEPEATATLIAYERPDLVGNKESRYRLVEVAEPAELRESLAAVLGIAVVVGKTRRLFIYEGVRIHLDRVDDLGDFIEFEGVAADGDDPGRFTDLLGSLRESFDVRDADLVRESYSDLLRA
jgi:predicted adenylyl cyclase CyaB